MGVRRAWVALYAVEGIVLFKKKFLLHFVYLGWGMLFLDYGGQRTEEGERFIALDSFVGP